MRINLHRQFPDSFGSDICFLLPLPSFHSFQALLPVCIYRTSILSELPYLLQLPKPQRFLENDTSLTDSCAQMKKYCSPYIDDPLQYNPETNLLDTFGQYLTFPAQAPLYHCKLLYLPAFPVSCIHSLTLLTVSKHHCSCPDSIP